MKGNSNSKYIARTQTKSTVANKKRELETEKQQWHFAITKAFSSNTFLHTFFPTKTRFQARRITGVIYKKDGNLVFFKKINEVPEVKVRPIQSSQKKYSSIKKRRKIQEDSSGESQSGNEGEKNQEKEEDSNDEEEKITKKDLEYKATSAVQQRRKYRKQTKTKKPIDESLSQSESLNDQNEDFSFRSLKNIIRKEDILMAEVLTADSKSEERPLKSLFAKKPHLVFNSLFKRYQKLLDSFELIDGHISSLFEIVRRDQRF